MKDYSGLRKRSTAAAATAGVAASMLASAFLFNASAQAQTAPASATCFAGQINHPYADRIAQSTVYLTWMDPQKGQSLDSSTGTVIANSASPNDRYMVNRIVTATHVLDDPHLNIKPGDRLAVIDSLGHFLGFAGGRAISSDAGRTELNWPKDDVSVLGIDAFVGTQGASLYAAIPGIEIAARQNADSWAGNISEPTAPGPGASGAGGIDANGKLAGVLVAGRNTGAPVTRMVGDPLKLNMKQFPAESAVTLSQSADVTLLPISDPDILQALGNAGKGVKPVSNPSDFKVTIAGYPFGNCVASAGIVHSVYDQRPAVPLGGTRPAQNQAPKGP